MSTLAKKRRKHTGNLYFLQSSEDYTNNQFQGKGKRGPGYMEEFISQHNRSGRRANESITQIRNDKSYNNNEGSHLSTGIEKKSRKSYESFKKSLVAKNQSVCEVGYPNTSLTFTIIDQPQNLNPVYTKMSKPGHNRESNDRMPTRESRESLALANPNPTGNNFPGSRKSPMKSYETDTVHSPGSLLRQDNSRQDFGYPWLVSDPNHFSMQAHYSKQAHFKKMMTKKFEKNFKKGGNSSAEGPCYFPDFLSKSFLKKSINKCQDLAKTRGGLSKDFSGQKLSTRGLKKEIQTFLLESPSKNPRKSIPGFL